MMAGMRSKQSQGSLGASKASRQAEKLACLRSIKARLEHDIKELESCQCKFTTANAPMDQSGCLVHAKKSYACEEHGCSCHNYRPQRETDFKNGHWALCVCGHIAQIHN